MPGIEPTNNAAEQALRPAVLWRKGCFGADSTDGNTFVARILTVAATCRQQQRDLLPFLADAVRAHWAGLPAPPLIPRSATHLNGYWTLLIGFAGKQSGG